MEKILVLSQTIDSKQGAKVTFIRAQQEKMYLRDSKAVLLISIGRPAHEGVKFAATIDMINKTFAACDIAVCDSLQRHTMRMYEDLPKEELYKKSNQEGEKWIERNNVSLKSIKITHEIFRWDKYLLNNHFNKYKAIIDLAYKENSKFAAAIHETIDEFIERPSHPQHLIDKEKAIESCREYLIEECAIIMLMWISRGYNYIVYPGEINKALAAARSNFVKPVSSNLLKWLGVYVRTRSGCKHNSSIFQENVT